MTDSYLISISDWILKQAELWWQNPHFSTQAKVMDLRVNIAFAQLQNILHLCVMISF